MQWNPGCAVTSSVPAFTYASRLPVTRQPAGVLVEVGYMEYLASMPPPVISITYKSVPLFTSLAPLIRFAVVSPYYGSFTLQLGSHEYCNLHLSCCCSSFCLLVYGCGIKICGVNSGNGEPQNV